MVTAGSELSELSCKHVHVLVLHQQAGAHNLMSHCASLAFASVVKEWGIHEPRVMDS